MTDRLQKYVERLITEGEGMPPADVAPEAFGDHSKIYPWQAKTRMLYSANCPPGIPDSSSSPAFV